MNLDLMVYLIGAFSIIWLIRSRRKVLLNKQTEFELYALRDKLRKYEFDGHIKPNSWSYDYLDQSICKTIDHLNEINIYSAFALNRIHKNDRSIKDFKDHLKSSVSENKKEAHVFKEYKQIILSYVLKKHKAFSFLFKIFLFVKIFNVLRKKGRKDIENFTILPETSASESFMNANGLQLT